MFAYVCRYFIFFTHSISLISPSASLYKTYFALTLINALGNKLSTYPGDICCLRYYLLDLGVLVALATILSHW